MRRRDFISMADLTAADVEALLASAARLKAGGDSSVLVGKSLVLLFEKPSLRTRVSFEVAMRQLGGYAVYLSPAEVGLGQREPVKDVARVLSRYVDGIAARTFSHDTIVDLAEHASVPIINALSDLEHPCQALGDLLTMVEKKGRLKGLRLAYIGDGNNIANSLMIGAALVGIDFRLAHPEGYAPSAPLVTCARELAAASGAIITFTRSPAEAAVDADVVYTDVWTSMGQEAEREARQRAFRGYIVDEALLALARPDAIVMHDLPAHRGEEISDAAIEGPQSVVFDQAENRLHAQKAVLAALLGA